MTISRNEENIEKELAYTRRYEVIRDSFFNVENLRLTIDHQLLYESQEKENKILEQKIKINDQKTQKNILSYILIFLSTIGLFGFLLLRHRLKYQRQINDKNKLIQDQEIKRLNQQNKLIALDSMIEGQEKERHRIAGDLHDGLGGLLTNIKAHFHAIDYKEKSKNDVYHKMNYLLDEACSEVRRIARNMTPNALKISGLHGAIRDIKNQLQIQGIDCNLDMEETFGKDLDEKIKLVIYRIVQESVTNIQKHSQAEQVWIKAYSTDRHLSILIEDDGVGFDVKQAEKTDGLGLDSLESRVKFLNGELQIDSVIDQGTTIIIEIPKNKA